MLRRIRLAYLLLMAAVLLVAALLSYRADPDSGLAGFGLGTALGALLCVVSSLCMRRARFGQGSDSMRAALGATAALRAMMLSLAACAALLIAGIVLVRSFLRPLLDPFALTALALYLVHRFFEAVACSSPARRPMPGNPSRSTLTAGHPACGALEPPAN
jgi:hypothetical protein